MPDKVLIIGYGNPLRGDDGIGPYAVDCLRDDLTDAVAINAAQPDSLGCSAITFLTPMQLTPELAEPISRAARVVFIDARTDGVPGAIHAQRLHPGNTTSTLTHHTDPAALLALAQALYGTCPDAVIFSVTGQSFGYEEGLAHVVKDALPILIERILGHLSGAHLIGK